MTQLISRAVLGLSALIAFAIASLILLDPTSFYASNGVTLPPSTSLMSELKAPASLLFCSALLLTAGAIFRKHTCTALWLNVLVFGSYALGRLASIAMDGVPSDTLVQASAIEALIAVISLALIIAGRDQPILA